jgi:hypothetical protein
MAISAAHVSTMSGGYHSSSSIIKGSIQCINDTTFMYHYSASSNIMYDTIIVQSTPQECLSVAQRYQQKYDDTIRFQSRLMLCGTIVGVVLVLFLAMKTLYEPEWWSDMYWDVKLWIERKLYKLKQK